MFRSISQQSLPPSPKQTHHSSTHTSTQPIMTKQRRPTLPHAQTLSALPDAHKQSKSRTAPASSIFASFLATFAPSSSTSDSTSPSSITSSASLKSSRSEVELRKDYLSPEREKEICELWDAFKRQNQDENQLTMFPPILEYDYDEQDDEEQQFHRR